MGLWQLPVRSVDQFTAPYRLPMIPPAGGVETPEFRDTDGGVDGRFTVDVRAGGTLGRDFHSPVGRLPHLPGKVDFAGSDRLGIHAKGQVDVGRSPHVQVARVVADKGFIIQKHVGALVEVGETSAEEAKYFRQFEVLFHGVGSHILLIGVELQAGIVNLALPPIGQHICAAGCLGGRHHRTPGQADCADSVESGNPNRKRGLGHEI